METIIFKVPDGTKSRLKQIDPNLSELLRRQIETLLSQNGTGSALEKAAALRGVFKGGPRNLSSGKDYLRQYAKKSHH